MFSNAIAFGFVVLFLGILGVKTQTQTCGSENQLDVPLFENSLSLTSMDGTVKFDFLGNTAGMINWIVFDPNFPIPGSSTIKTFMPVLRDGNYIVYKSQEKYPDIDNNYFVVKFCLKLEQRDGYYVAQFSGTIETSTGLYYTLVQHDAPDPPDFCTLCGENTQNKAIAVAEVITDIPTLTPEVKCKIPSCCTDVDCTEEEEEEDPLTAICEALAKTLKENQMIKTDPEKTLQQITTRKRHRKLSRNSLFREEIRGTSKRGKGKKSSESSAEDKSGEDNCKCPNVEKVKCLLGELSLLCWQHKYPDFDLLD